MSSWQEHLSNIREEHPNRNLKECMQIASQSWKSSSNKNEMHYVKKKEEKIQKPKPKNKNIKSKSHNECKDTLIYIINLSKDLTKVTHELSERDLKSLRKAEQRISKIHDSFQESASSSSDDDSDSESD